MSRLVLNDFVGQYKGFGFSIVLFLLLFASMGYSQTVFVKAGASGNGTSWANATGDLKTALESATPGTAIWVAAGVYTPTNCSTCQLADRQVYFQLKTGVSLYGGFGGTETDLSQRNITANPTILSGDIDSDGLLTHNSYTILFSENATNCRVDGFIFQDGNAQSVLTAFGEMGNSGAAWYNKSILQGNFSNPVAANCTFRNNHARAFGGAVYQGGAFSGSVVVTFEQCTFENNSAETFGGALYMDVSFSGTGTLRMTYCTVMGNQTQTSGGAISAYGTENGDLKLDLSDVHFEGNTAVDRGGAIYVFCKNGSLNGTVASSYFEDNDAGLGGAVFFNVNGGGKGGTMIQASSFKANVAEFAGGAIYLEATDGGSDTTHIDQCQFENNQTQGSGGAVFINAVLGWAKTEISASVFSRNSSVSYGGALYNFGKTGLCQPLIHNCLFFENQGSSSGAIYNLGSDNGNASPDIINCTFYGNKASVGACIYNQANDFTGTCNPNVTNCVFWGNHANFGPIFQNGHAFPTISHCVFDVPDCEALNSGINGMTTCGPGLLFQVDPLFADSSSQNFRLASNSPVVNIGNNAILNNFGITKDLDGMDRVEDGMVDYGAYEYRTAYIPPSIITQSGDTAVCSGADVVLEVQAEGTPPLSYQWLLNGIPLTGETANTIGLNDISTADGGTYRCQLSSAQGDLVTSDEMLISVEETVLPVAVINASETQICANEEVVVTAQLSNEGNAPLINWFLNGSLMQTGGMTYTSSSFEDGDILLVEMNSSRTCVEESLVSSNAIAMQVGDPQTVSVSITEPDAICEGEALTFEATGSNAGNNPTYEWLLNGNLIGNGSDFTFNNLQDGDVVQCRLTSSLSCVVTNPVVSDSSVVQVLPKVDPTVSITSSANAICAGEVLSFMAQSTNGGINPQYQWLVNGLFINELGSTFSTQSLADGDQVAVQMTASVDCPSVNPVSSNVLQVAVTPTVTPAVNIEADVVKICPGEAITFTASTTNSGANPTYQWLINDLPVSGVLGSTYVTDVLENGDVVHAVLTSSLPCLMANPVFSNGVSITVHPESLPAVDLMASTTTLCAGESVDLIATPIDAGTNPSFEWLVNGVLINQTGPQLSSDAFEDGDQVSVRLTSSLPCPLVNPVESNVIELEVMDLLLPTVAIEASKTNICAGEEVSFTANITQGGVSPSYQWLLNDIPVPGATEIVFQTNTLQDGDRIGLSMFSSVSCVQTNPVEAASIQVSVSAISVPTVDLQLMQQDPCEGGQAVFEALPVAGGANPVYTWVVNGAAAPNSNAPVFTLSDIQNGDVVYCQMESSAPCSNPVLVESSELIILASALQTPSISLGTAQVNICGSEPISFSANATFAGSSPSYEWYVNGQLATTGLSSSYTLVNPQDGDEVYAILISDADCVTTNQVTSEAVSVSVVQEVMPVLTLSASAQTICEGEEILFQAINIQGGGVPSFEWLINGEVVQSGASDQFIWATPIDGAEVTCRMTSSLSCTTVNPVAADPMVVSVDPLVIPTLQLTVLPTSVCIGTPMTVIANTTEIGANPLYDWFLNGQLIQSSALDQVTILTPQPGDQVACSVHTNLICIPQNPLLSEPVALQVNPGLIPTIEIQASEIQVCAADSVQFTATIVNGGSQPAFQWFINGVPQTMASGAVVWLTNFPENAEVTCLLSSNADCLQTDQVLSNGIPMDVTPSPVPAISLTTASMTICEGEPLVVQAEESGGGTSPTFVWTINGQDTSTQTNTLSLVTLPEGSYTIQCELLSSADCAFPASGISEVLTVEVTPMVDIQLEVTANAQEICEGDVVTFSAQHDAPFPASEYVWTIDGVIQQSGPSSAFTTSNLKDGSLVQVSLLFPFGCLAENPAVSTPLQMMVMEAAQPMVEISTADLLVCPGDTIQVFSQSLFGGNNPDYEWFLNGELIESGPSDLVTDRAKPGDTLQCKLLTSLDCAINNAALSNQIILEEDENCLLATHALQIDDLSIFPNPTNGVLHLHFTLSEKTQLDVLNPLGQALRTEVLSAGPHRLQWNLNEPEGVYFMRWMQPNGQILVKRIVLIR